MMAALTIAGTVLTPVTAHAQGEAGRRNTTIGLGALTGYLFTRGGNKTGAFIAAGATAIAYKRYEDSINARHKRERIARIRAQRRAEEARRRALAHHKLEHHAEHHG